MTARSTNIIEQVEDVLRQIKFSETTEFKQNDGEFRTLCLNSMSFSSYTFNL